MSDHGPNRESVVKGVELELDLVRDGLETVPAGTNFIVNGKPMTAAELMKEVDSRRALYKDARDLRSQLKARTREKRDRKPEMKAFIKDVRTAVTASLGRLSPQLVKFGFEAEKERPRRTSEELALAAARSRETREARHTLGPREKAGIKGEVDSVELVDEGSDVKSIPSAPGKKPSDGQ